MDDTPRTTITEDSTVQTVKADMMLRLPIELATQIFLYAWCENHKPHSHKSSLLSTAEEIPPKEAIEVILSHVSRRFRAIMTGIPRFWSKFHHFCPPWGSSKSCSLAVASYNRLQNYLRLSKSHPLDLYFDLTQCPKASCHSDMFDIATQESHRWRNLGLVFRELFGENLEPWSEAFGPMLGTWDHTHVPILETLTIKCGDIRLENTHARRIFRDGAPKLFSFSSDAMGHVRFMPPHANITTLSLQEFPDYLDTDPWPTLQTTASFHCIIEVLRLPALECLSLTGHYFSLDSPIIAAGITAARLKFLKISKSASLLWLLPFLEAPSLLTLVIERIGICITDGEHFFPNLQSLVLLDTTYKEIATQTPHHPAPFFKLTRNIRELVVSQGPKLQETDAAVNAVLRDLQAMSPGGWQNLEVITIDLARVSTASNFCLKIGYLNLPPDEIPRRPRLRLHKNVLNIWRKHGDSCLDTLNKFFIVDEESLLVDNTLLLTEPIHCCDWRAYSEGPHHGQELHYTHASLVPRYWTDERHKHIVDHEQYDARCCTAYNLSGDLLAAKLKKYPFEEIVDPFRISPVPLHENRGLPDDEPEYDSSYKSPGYDSDDEMESSSSHQ